MITAVPIPKPLGYFRDKSVELYGEDSPCTKWIDSWIEQHPEGRELAVQAEEGMVLAYMEKVHQGLPTKPVVVPPTGN